ncbi:MAG: thioredoxin family protein [Fretibacterium sp.]|nr:thioredoxin family protein [Fretibacterium sp.]
MKKLLISLFAAMSLAAGAVFPALPASAQAPENIVRWKVEVKDVAASEAAGGATAVLEFSATILPGWHIYGLNDPDNATVITLEAGAVAVGEPYAVSKGETLQGREVFSGKAVFAQRVALGAREQKGPKTQHPPVENLGGASKSAENDAANIIRGTVTYSACNDQMCTPPLDWEFEIKAAGLGTTDGEGANQQKGAKMTVSPSENGGIPAKMAENDGSLSDESAVEVSGESAAEGQQTVGNSTQAGTGGGLWALILEAILWGLAMLLTPCVFPMVPMTVSFFLKGESTPAAGRFKALMYGLFIVLLYTVPISIIIILTRAIGGDAVTADIFNWLATHWLPNIIFFIVFMVFAASFFGAFEITLPSKWVNGSDAKASKGSLGGIFFLALTLVLVSFSCTGPIVGTVLIKSTAGEFWAPMITMLAFSLAFALPFTLLAMFPGLLKKLPKSGGWLNSVKVCLGFIEVALGLKFLSVADQTYHWGILGRKLYLIIWIICFALMGLYLLGVIRFKRDARIKRLSALRIILSLASFAFVAYLATGLWGAPLKALSGYLPPMEVKSSELAEGAGNKYGLKMPLGLPGYFTLEEGLEAAKAENKPVFVDVTGHGCVNCREMEQRVWSDPRVLEILRNHYIIVALYNDDKTPLDPSDWVTTPSGKVLKDLGRVNSYIARERFGVNAQPNYILLSPDGTQLAPPRGYNLDIEGFLAFLAVGLE